MERSSLPKLAVAFLVGLVLALGSALVFMRTRQPQPAVPVVEVQEQSAAPEPEARAEPTEAPEADATVRQERPIAERPSETAPVKVPALTKVPTPAKPNLTKTAIPRNWENTSLSPVLLPPVQVVQNTSPDTSPALPTAAGSAPAYPALSQPAQDEVGPQAPPPPQPHVVELAAGTILAIRLGETISTEHNYTGDAFRGTLEEPIVRNGFIIADKGSKVLGRVVNADPAGRVRGVSNLSVTLTEINTTDRQRIRVQTNSVEKSGPTSTGMDTAKIAGGAALGAIIGALGGGGKGAAIGAGAGGAAGTGLVLATRGKPAVLPNESRLTFQLASPVTITEKLNN